MKNKNTFRRVVKLVKPFVRKIITAIVSIFAVATFVVFNGSTQHLQTSVLHTLERGDTTRFAAEELPTIPTVNVCDYTAPDKPSYSGEFVNKEVGVIADPGADFSGVFYFKNTGNVAWFGDDSGCTSFPKMRLGTARSTDRDSIFYHPSYTTWIQANRLKMYESLVMPGETATFFVSSKAPKVSGDIFREYFQPVVEGVSWMTGQNTVAHMDVHVGEISPDAEVNKKYLGTSGQLSSLDLTGTQSIQVDISEQKLRVKFGETVVREYTVSTGTYKTPTPLGTFKILNKQELRIGGKAPHYRMPQWQGFTKWGHGFHALPYLANDKGVFWNEALNHIGQRVSHGCIRLLPEDAVDLYDLTEVGMEIRIQA